MDRLPFIDEHGHRTGTDVDAVWVSLIRFLAKNRLGGAALFARILGCNPLRGSADFTGRPGETMPGFQVVESDPGRRLVLNGRHRFALYTLTFDLDEDRLTAQTHATFPGVIGKLYRAAVIGSGAHRLVVRSMLRQVVRNAGNSGTSHAA